MNEKFTCPRRIEDGRDREDSPFVGSGPNQDEWLSGHGLAKQARGCNYCGSMHPDDFMRAVREGVKIGPTDKGYKAYVGDHDGKFYYQHLNEEQKREFVSLLNERRVHIGYPGHFYVLPYFLTRG